MRPIVPAEIAGGDVSETLARRPACEPFAHRFEKQRVGRRRGGFVRCFGVGLLARQRQEQIQQLIDLFGRGGQQTFKIPAALASTARRAR